ncbi:hypothetical protein [Nocardia sp. NPDC046763]|uniref:hypothetical protein n=1 Tax=Nocardia sp. NPDC046763 TaxID=3155256 RepID=UPI0033F7DE83
MTAQLTSAYRELLTIGIRTNRILVAGRATHADLVMALLANLREGGLSPPGATVLLAPDQPGSPDAGLEHFRSVSEAAAFIRTYLHSLGSREQESS